MTAAKKPGLYANIHAKQERIKKGSGEKMRKPGSKGAPTAESLEKSKTSRSSGRKTHRRVRSRRAKSRHRAR